MEGLKTGLEHTVFWMAKQYHINTIYYNPNFNPNGVLKFLTA